MELKSMNSKSSICCRLVSNHWSNNKTKWNNIVPNKIFNLIWQVQFIKCLEQIHGLVSNTYASAIYAWRMYLLITFVKTYFKNCLVLNYSILPAKQRSINGTSWMVWVSIFRIMKVKIVNWWELNCQRWIWVIIRKNLPCW